MTTYLGISGAGEGTILSHPVYTRDDSKISLNILMRLQGWVSAEFQNLQTTFLNDSNQEQYLRITRSTPHPLLLIQPSVQIVCRVDKDGLLNCQLLAYNSISIKELVASLDEEYEDLKLLLGKLNNHQTSICKGIPEEKLVTWAIRKNLSQILIERFLTRVVFRERDCHYVMFESDQADICRKCALLLSSSNMDLHGDQELECPDPGCSRTFKYQGALDKHIQKHKESDDEMYLDEKPCKVKLEDRLNNESESNKVKTEPEISVKEAKTEDQQYNSDDGQLIERLLDDIDQETYPSLPPRRLKKKKKLKKPPNKDFSCSDCGKAFYYQKNLFTHVVEAHGKSVDELPNLALVKTEDGRKRKRRKKGKGLKHESHCDECGVSFKFASGLYNHRKRMHGDTEKVQCHHCNKMIKSCTLDQHIREEHGTPRYACQFCGKGFYYKSFMLNHQRLHTGDYKECICDLCGAVYKSVQVLNRHVRNAHQDLRNFKCSHCDKAFHNKQRLDRHVNSQHTKSKLWPCPACHSKYDRKDNLRTHIRKNHAGVINPDTVNLVPIENDGIGVTGTEPQQSGRKAGRTANSTASANQILSQNFVMLERINGQERSSTFPSMSDRSQSMEDSRGDSQDFLDPDSGYRSQDIIKREDTLLTPSHLISRHENDLLRLAAVHQHQNIHQQHDRGDAFREKHQDRFNLHSPPSTLTNPQHMRDMVSAAVRDFTSGGQIRENAHTPPSLQSNPNAVLTHALNPNGQNTYTFHGLHGHPQL